MGLLGGLYRKLERFAVNVYTVRLGASLTGPLIEASGSNVKVPGLIVGSTTFSEAEFGVLDGVTPGTVLASRALIVDANKDLADLRNLSSTNLKAGKDAVAGSVVVFPATTARGSAKITVSDQTGNTLVTQNFAAMGQATTLTVPDPGAANADFVLTGGAQAVTGVKTFDNAGLKIKDSDASHGVTISPGNEAADRVLSLPVLGGADTVATLGTAQTFTGTKTFAGLLTTSNVGTVETGTTAVEHGDARQHVTVLTVSTTLPAIAGGANLAVGKLLYTFPAGAIAILAAKMSLAITQSQGNITADTPDGGLGSVIGSGVVATLDGTATFENILTGQTFNDCNGTAEVKTVANQPMVMETGSAHTIHFNVADGWAASGDAAAGLAGTVILHWVFLG